MSGHTYDQVSLAKRFASRRAAKRKSAVMRLNLTAMIDVIFLLLVYFVVTANFATGEGVLTTRMSVAPAGEASETSGGGAFGGASGGASGGGIEVPPMTPLRIYLYAQGLGGYRIGVAGVAKQPTNFTELAEVLTRLQRSGDQRGGQYAADDPVMIAPVGKVRWEYVVNAFNAAIKARFENVQFAERAK